MARTYQTHVWLSCLTDVLSLSRTSARKLKRKRTMKTKNSKEQLTPDNMESQSLEVSMLNKDNFSDKELESYLSKGEIKATDKITIPPKILFVGDCTIATFGNFDVVAKLKLLSIGTSTPQLGFEHFAVLAQ